LDGHRQIIRHEKYLYHLSLKVLFQNKWRKKSNGDQLTQVYFEETDLVGEETKSNLEKNRKWTA